MSKPTTQVNYKTLKHIAKSFHQESEDIMQIQRTTRENMNALQNGWSGSAANAFFATLEGNLLPGVERLARALLTSETVLNQIIKTFHEADQETTKHYKFLDEGDVSTSRGRPPGRAKISADWPPPNTEDYDVRIQPEHISFSEKQENLDEPDIFKDGEKVEPGTEESQYINGHQGLCGQASVAAILNHVIPGGISVNEVVENYMKTINSNPDYTDAEDLARFINERYHDYIQADGDNVTLNSWITSTENQNEKLNEQLPGLVNSWLDQGDYVIAAVDINNTNGRLEDDGSDHWVVITGLSEQWNTPWPGEDQSESPGKWVRVYNPFNNQTEYYSWKDFSSSWCEDEHLNQNPKLLQVSFTQENSVSTPMPNIPHYEDNSPQSDIPIEIWRYERDRE